MRRDTEHTIVFGEGDQTLRWYPPAPVTGALYLIEDFEEHTNDEPRTIASGAAQLDPLDTTLAAASGRGRPDPRRVEVASLADVTASHSYVVTHPDTGQWEHFTVAGVGDAYVVAEHPLTEQYPTGSTVAGWGFSATFPASWADDEEQFDEGRHYRAIWKTDVAGRPVNVPRLIRHVRTANSDSDDIRAVLDLARDLHEGLTFWRSYDDDLRRFVYAARDMVRAQLLAHDIEPETFMSGPQGRLLMYHRFMLLCIEAGYRANQHIDPAEELRSWGDRYRYQFGALTRGQPGKGTSQVERDSDQGHPPPSRAVFRRIV